MKKLKLGIAIMIACMSLSACSPFSSGNGVGSSAASYDSAGVSGFGSIGTNAMASESVRDSSSSAVMDSLTSSQKVSRLGSESGNTTTNNTKEQSNQKLIRTVSMNVKIDSSEYLEDTVKSVTELVDSYDGWVAYNNVDYGSRYAGGTLELRIPKDNVDTFLDVIENSDLKLMSISDNMEDVTMKYVDTESRLKVKTSQRDKYMQYLEQATTISEVLEIEDRLSEVISDIESYEQQIKAMDSLIEYTEVNLRIQCETSINRESFWERFKTSLKDIREDVGDTFLGGLEWFLNALITLIFVIPIIIIVVRSIVLALTGRWRFKRKDESTDKENKLTLKDRILAIKNKMVTKKENTKLEDKTEDK